MTLEEDVECDDCHLGMVAGDLFQRASWSNTRNRAGRCVRCWLEQHPKGHRVGLGELARYLESWVKKNEERLLNHDVARALMGTS